MNKQFQTQFTMEAVNSLIIKNCEGHDRIPLRVIMDGIKILLTQLTVLFSKIYEQKTIPAQWLTAKIIPIHKKGNLSDIKNYRPISNLCLCSKIYKKLILT